MIIEISHFLSVLAAGLFFLVGYFALFTSSLNTAYLSNLISRTYSHGFLFLICSFIIYVWLAITDNFSVQYIANHSNTALPTFYKISSIWSAHEGSMFLWIVFLSLWGFIFNVTVKNEEILKAKSIGIISFVIVGFLLFLLATSNPFATILPIAPLNGADINPVLQDPALAIHPPTLYLGYVGFVIPFACAISFLLEGKTSIKWEVLARKWSIAAWVFLTVGITLGSWWAYYELGWGGWLFWDPVENAAFVPWLLSVALFHSLITSQNRGVFGKWSILLSIFAFATSLLGTFLVRSGILTSVHAFALDPERGLFILAILAFFVIGSLLIYSIMDFGHVEENKYELTSKEFGFLLNNLLLVVLAISILFGTIFPLIYEAFTGGKQISVGAPYFEIILFPFALALGSLQGVALYLSWGKSSSFDFLPRLLIESLSIFSLIILILFVLFDNLYLSSFATIFLASWILVGTLQMTKKRNLSYWNFLRKRLAVTFAHAGMAILIIGVGVVSSYSLEKEIILSPGDSTQFSDQTINFQSIDDLLGPNYTSKSAIVSFDDGGELSNIVTEKRTYLPSGQITTEAGIQADLFKDLYVSIGDNLQSNIWSFKIQIKPFIRWIWLGALLIAIGSFLAGVKQFKRI